MSVTSVLSTGEIWQEVDSRREAPWLTAMFLRLIYLYPYYLESERMKGSRRYTTNENASKLEGGKMEGFMITK